MFKYQADMDPGPLTAWPFDAPQSAYCILSGTPEASGRIDAGGAGQTSRTGIWRCTAGSFECTEQGDELMTLLSGRCRITDLTTGAVLDLGVGDSAFVRDGQRVRWDILDDVTKVFFGHKATGY